jgi:hypothetical protein
LYLTTDSRGQDSEFREQGLVKKAARKFHVYKSARRKFRRVKNAAGTIISAVRAARHTPEQKAAAIKDCRVENPGVSFTQHH